MTVFRGIFHNSTDDKGRMSIPARFREQIRENHESPLILILGFEKTISIYPLDEWKKIESKLTTLDNLNEEKREFQRRLMKAMDEVEIDQQGRIMISPVLRREADIKKNVVIVGMLNRIEVWDKQNYENYHKEKAKVPLEHLGQKLSDKGMQSINL
jgi:MraZ protein